MTQNLNFKLLKWQEAIRKIKETGWNMTPDSKASYCKVIWSAVTFIGKTHSHSLHGEQHLLQLRSNALQARITHFPPPSPQSQASVFIWDESSSPGEAHLSPPTTQEAWTELYLAS